MFNSFCVATAPMPLDMAQIGAVVLVEEEGSQYNIFIVPEGVGGYDIIEGETRIVTVSPTSPIGKVLLGKQGGEEIEIATPSGQRILEILEVG